ncbi:MAG: 2-oxo acid dehydrogenase subunit E2 [Dehalococcoidia bacterium]|nr:2-oxo acid dehydrogenase subunit E2 [Dehalococcoidia bacterium]
MGEFRMPSLGADMTDGTVTRWLVKPGDLVKRGEIVAEVETDKADMEVEIWETGVIDELVVAEGEKVPVGTLLARLHPAAETADTPAGGTASAAPTAPTTIAEVAAPPGKRTTPTARALAREMGVDLARVTGSGVQGAITRSDVERAAAKAPALSPSERMRVSPFARRLARDLGVEIELVAGSGPGGAITSADIRRAAAGSGHPVVVPPAEAASGTEKPRPAYSRTPLANLMERSNREIPHYYLEMEIDMSRALAWLASENARRPVTERLIYSALLIRAVALACHDVPDMSGYWRDGAFEPSPDANVGVAISLRKGGLVAPAIIGTAEKSLGVIMAELRDLVMRARGGKLRASEMTAGTITVTNLGELGVDLVFGVIYPPQVALVGFGRIREQPWAENGMLGVRPVIKATLSADHRASDGHRGGLFLSAINKLLQEPERL